MSDLASEVEELEHIFADVNALPIQMSYALIKSITKNFAQAIGNGASGVVYLGGLSNGMVAVKKLSQSTKDLSDTQFLEEIKCLNKLKHKNIVRFLGYCADATGIIMEVEGKLKVVEAPQRLLCFEYVPNGRLHDYIQGKNHGYEWSICYQIIMGICEGLHYLHQEHIYHLDLNPVNVLLGVHMEPKITDFGVSRLVDENQSTIFTVNVFGTRGYIAPEFIDEQRISVKNDIYSLGMIIERMLAGSAGNITENGHEFLNVDCKQMKTCMEIAKSCAARDPSKRPTISEIVLKLNVGEATNQNVPPFVNEPRNDPMSSSNQVVKRFQALSARTFYEYSSALHQLFTQHDPSEKEASASFEFKNMEMEYYNDLIRQNPQENNDPISEKEASVSFEFTKEEMDFIRQNPQDSLPLGMKMHRWPRNILDLGERYTVPKTVAIGPYHHGGQQLKQAEQAKRVAAYHCIRESGCSVLELYSSVVSVVDECYYLYDKDVMAGISVDDFRHMMFFDACFLVQFMVWFTDFSSEETDPSLRSFFYLNRHDIDHDVVLLENQLSWRVVETVMKFRPLPLDKFIGLWRYVRQPRQDLKDVFFALDNSYEPPHLLGLLRYYTVGRRNYTDKPNNAAELGSMSFSASATKLGKIGITLTANETTEIVDMGLSLNKRGIFFAELTLAPLSLNYARANQLVNMAALELCTTPNFLDAIFEDSTVCSYLLILSMMVDGVEDVHELRRGGILQGEGGLTNKETLHFFTGLESLPRGLCYSHVMAGIERCRANRKMRTQVHAFLHRFANCMPAVYKD